MNSSIKLGNQTDVSTTLYYELPMAVRIPKLTIEIALALVGVLGNLLVCIVITKRASMKTTMNLYLRSLAIADLGVLLVNFPLTVIAQMAPFPFGENFCLYIAPATEIFYGASIWSITVIAFERYRNIISRRSFGKRPESSIKINLKILGLWLVSFIVVSVPMYPYMLYSDQNKVCYPDWPQSDNNMTLIMYTIGLAIFWYLLPLAIITFTYVKISRRLTQSNQFHKGMHAGNNFAKSQLIRDEEKQRLKQNKKAQRILTPLVVVFALSMLPLTIFRLTFAFYPAFVMYKYYGLLFSVCAVFVVVNSAADPIVYYISSKEFRKVLEAYLCKGRRESSVLSTSHVDSPANSVNLTMTVQTKI